MSVRDGGTSFGKLSERVRPYGFCVDEMLDLADKGWWRDEDVELVSGTVMVRESARPPHAGQVNRLAQFFHRLVGEEAIVSTQNPVLLSEDSLPVPDLALLAPRGDFYTGAHPEADDVWLIIEVADTSRRYDLDTKARLYAHAGLPEYWVVDLPARTLHIHRSPTPDGYDHLVRTSSRDIIVPVELPEVSVAVEAVL